MTVSNARRLISTPPIFVASRSNLHFYMKKLTAEGGGGGGGGGAACVLS